MCNLSDFPKEFKGFDLISCEKIPDCNSIGIYLKHKKTGLEIFHLFNDDEENLFAYTFRTPIKNSTGAAHILEHSVFCGSQKMPLKEPFTNLMNQSVNTFLNAITYPDKTVYPASSMIKADYYNLLDVYSDAVFFPLLKKEAFMQEAHRLEINDKGEFEIQGVVYNEMKGNYSSFDSVADDEQLRSLFPNTNYAFDSGGDPLEIPHFTYEDFKAFHKKFYTPQNCLLFLYGNIPTQEQLDFLQEKLLNRLEEKANDFSTPLEDFEKIETPQPITTPIHISKTAPEAGATGSTVTINWLCGDTSDLDTFMECKFLSEVIAGHDGSPLTKALLDSELGNDTPSFCGCITYARKFSLAFGLCGVKEKNAQKVFDTINNTLENLCKTGVEQKYIDSALMTIEFSNREIVRADGPYSLVLLERALNGWNYGKNPSSTLLYQAAFEKICKNLKNDKNYTVNLIKKYLIENKSATYVTVSPSKSYLKNREKQEKSIIAELSKEFSSEEAKNELKKQLEDFHKYQQHHETDEEIECIPTLNLSNLKTDVEKIKTDIDFIETNGKSIAVFKNTEATNGIAYIEAWVPVDLLNPEYYKYLSLYSYCVNNMGWGGKSWAECAEETAILTGGLSCRLYSNIPVETKNSSEIKKKIEKINAYNRDWLIFSMKTLRSKLDSAMDLFSDCISSVDFKDFKRLSILTSEFSSIVKANVIPNGSRLASIRAQCHKTRSSSADEIWYGITQLFAISEIEKIPTQILYVRFKSITEQLKSAGVLLHITADTESMQETEKLLPKFIEKSKLLPLAPKSIIQEKENFLLEQTILPCQKTIEKNEIFTVPSSVGFCATAINGSLFGSEENPNDIVLAHYLSGTHLWERIRTTGGAYGASATSINLAGLFVLSSYRDPTPQKSVKSFIECISSVANDTISEKELSRMISGVYGDEVQPYSPKSKGKIGIARTLSCIDEKDKEQKIKGIFKVTPEKLKNAAKNILEKADSSRTAIICNKSSKLTGDIIDLPL